MYFTKAVTFNFDIPNKVIKQGLELTCEQIKKIPPYHCFTLSHEKKTIHKVTKYFYWRLICR